MGHSRYDPAAKERRPWNAGRMVGAKRPLKPQQVWAIWFWLDRERRLRDRAMFDLAIDSKLRGCDVVKVRIGDLVIGGQIRSRAIVIQQKTGRPVQFDRTFLQRRYAARLPAAVIFSPGPAAAARRRIKAFRATADCWTSACVRSAASRIGPAIGEGGSCSAVKLA
jgi:hypothetical protein